MPAVVGSDPAGVHPVASGCATGDGAGASGGYAGVPALVPDPVASGRAAMTGAGSGAAGTVPGVDRRLVLGVLAAAVPESVPGEAVAGSDLGGGNGSDPEGGLPDLRGWTG